MVLGFIFSSPLGFSFYNRTRPGQFISHRPECVLGPLQVIRHHQQVAAGDVVVHHYDRTHVCGMAERVPRFVQVLIRTRLFQGGLEGERGGVEGGQRGCGRALGQVKKIVTLKISEFQGKRALRGV